MSETLIDPLNLVVTTKSDLRESIRDALADVLRGRKREAALPTAVVPAPLVHTIFDAHFAWDTRGAKRGRVVRINALRKEDCRVLRLGGRQ